MQRFNRCSFFALSAVVTLSVGGVSSLLLAGCSPASKSVGATTANGKPVVRVAFFPNVTHAAALVASGRGAFAKAVGADATVEERVFTAGPEEIEALFAGEVDLGYLGPGPALNGYLKSGGKALQIVAGASSGGAGLVARPDGGIRSVADLAGKRVAIPQTGGTQDISLRHALGEAGLASTDKNGNVAVSQCAPADAIGRFDSKQIDAAWLPEPWVSRLVADKTAVLVLDERDRWPGRKFATTVVIVRTEFMNQHPDLVQKLLEAHAESVAYINAHPSEAKIVIGKRIADLTKKSIPPAVLSSALAHTDITYDPLPASVQTFAAWSEELGYQKKGTAQQAVTGLINIKPLTAALAAQKLPPLPAGDGAP